MEPEAANRPRAAHEIRLFGGLKRPLAVRGALPAGAKEHGACLGQDDGEECESGDGSVGVASQVSGTNGAIGYFELSFGHPRDVLSALKSLLARTAGPEGQKDLSRIAYAPRPQDVAAQVRQIVRSLA